MEGQLIGVVGVANGTSFGGVGFGLCEEGAGGGFVGEA